jgi:hypothetical protein
LVADTLSKILNKAQSERYIKGISNFNAINITHLQFADDTLIFLEVDDRSLATLKLLLVGFENLSGLKINYSKSELIPLNVTNTKVIIVQIF